MGLGAKLPASRRAGVAALAVAVVVMFGAGILVGSGTIRLPAAPTPQTIYVTPAPPSESGGVAVLPTLVGPSPSDEASASASASTEPGASASRTAGPATTRPVTPAPVRPNLIFTGSGNNVAYCEESGTASAHIRNDSAVPTGRAVEVTLTDTYGGHVAYTGTRTVPVLAPGASFHAVFTVVIHTGCTSAHELTFRVDPTNQLAERYETDNVWTMPYLIHPYLPNLVVTNVRLSTGTPRCAVGFDVTVTVTNAGPRTTGHDGLLRVVDMVGTTPLRSQVVSFPAIDPHSSVDATVHMTLLAHCGETHHLVSTPDYNGAIDEISEGDNLYSFLYTLYA
jgi:hypothetical protein